MGQEDDIVVKLSMDISNLLKGASTSKLEIQKLKDSLNSLFAVKSTGETEIDVLSKRLQKLERVAESLSDTIGGMTNSQLTGATKLERVYKNVEAQLDKIKAKLASIQGAGTKPSTVIGGDLTTQVQSLRSVQRLTRASDQFSSLEESLSIPGGSKSDIDSIKRNLARFKKVIPGLKDKVEKDLIALEKINNISGIKEQNLLRDLAGLVAKKGGDVIPAIPITDRTLSGSIGRAPTAQRLNARLLRSRAEQLSSQSQAQTLNQFAEEVTGKKLRNLSKNQRQIVTDFFQGSFGTQFSAGQNIPKAPEGIANKIAGGQFSQEELASYLSGKPVGKLAKTDVASAGTILGNETLLGGVIAKAKAEVSESAKKTVAKVEAAVETGAIQGAVQGIKTAGKVQPANLIADKSKRLEQEFLAKEIMATQGLKTRDQTIRTMAPKTTKVPPTGGPGSEGQLEGVFRRTALYSGSAFAIYGAVAQIQKFFTTMVQMDKQLADLRKTLGGTDQDFSKLMQSAIDIARTYKGSTQDVLDAMEMFSAQFKSQSALEGLSKAAILLKNLSGQGLKESAETVTSTIEQYNMAVSSAGHITDAWAKVSSTSAVGIKDLGDAVGAAGGAARAAGVDFDQLNGMVGTIAASTGKSGKEIGNALKRIFERSTSPENIKELNKLGVFVNKANGDFRNFGDVIAELSTRWDHLGNTQKKQIAVAFAGARQYDSFLALMNNYSQSLQLTSTSVNSLGEAERQNSRIGDTFVKKVQLLSTEYDKLARSAGSSVLPILGSMVDILTKLARAFNESSKAAKTFGSLVAVGGAAGLAGSFLFKAAFTRPGAGGLVARSGNSVAAGISEYAIGPTFMRPGLERGGVSLLGGLGKYAAQNSILGKVPTLSGNLASSVEGTGLATVLARTTAGFAALAIVIAGIVAAGNALIILYNTLRDRTSDTIKIQEENNKIAIQSSNNIARISSQLTDAILQRGDIKNPQERSRFDRTTLGPLIKDALSDETVKKNLPNLKTETGINFDQFGNVILKNNDSLKKFQRALDSLSEQILNRNFANTFGNQLNASQNVNGTNTAQQILTRVGLLRNPFATNASLLENQGGTVPESLKNPSPVTSGNINRAIGVLVSQVGSGQVSSNNIDEFLNSNKEFNKALGSTNLSLTGKKSLYEIANNLVDLQRVNQESFDTIQARLQKEILDAKTPKELNKAIANLKTFTEKTNYNIRQGFGGDALAKYAYVSSTIPNAGDAGKGVAGPGKNQRIKLQNVDIPRIDFELQKSLTSNVRNFDMFGGEVKFVENGINVIKQAMSDLANNTEKAAGPFETISKLVRDADKANILEKISDIQKDKINPQKKEELIFAQQLKLAALDEKQAIKDKSVEAEKGLEILKVELARLQQIQDVQESLRAPAKYLLGQGALSAFTERATQLGQTTETGLSGRGTLQAQKEYLQAQLEQQQQINANELASLTSSGAGSTEISNAQIRGENALKHIREQMKALDKQIDDVAKKTNVWSNALQMIGDKVLSKITDRLVDLGIEKLGKTLSGGVLGGGFNLFGQANPQEMALSQNTAAIQQLTSAIIAANAGGSLGGAAGIVNGQGLDATQNAAKLAKDDVKRRADAQAQAKAIGEATSKSSLNSSLSAGLTGALLGAGLGYSITQGRGREGSGGATGGAIGGAIGGLAYAFPQTAAYAPLIQGATTLAGSWIGSMFDKPLNAEVPQLDKLEDPLNNVSYELQQLQKSLNTVNDTMENLINAPGNFVLPVPKGILEGSVTAQSALATPLQAGGLIRKSGLGFLHANEIVSPAGSNNGGSVSISPVFHIDGGNSNPQEIANEVMNRLNSVMYTQSQRLGRKSMF